MILEDVYRLLPEHEWIADAELRKKCAEVWLDALTQGGWDEKGPESLPIVLSGLNASCPYNDLDHIRAVARIAKEMTDALEATQGDAGTLDCDAVVVGALLHDVGNFIEADKGADGRCIAKPEAALVNHPCSGAFLAQKHGLPVEIVHIVLAHSELFSPEGGRACKTREAMIVKYADCASFYHLLMHYGS